MLKKLFGLGKKKEEVELIDENENQLNDDNYDTEEVEKIEEISDILSEDILDSENVFDDLNGCENQEEILNFDSNEIIENVLKESKDTQKDKDTLHVDGTSLSNDFKNSNEESEEIIEEEPKKKISFFEKLKSGLTKTSKAITDKIDDLLNDYGQIDDDLFDELEEILITADIGMSTTMDVIDKLKTKLKVRKIQDSSQVKLVLHDVMVEILKENNNSIASSFNT